MADPRLKDKITLWPSSDNACWGWWAVMAGELGYDYHNLDDMKKTLKWIAENIHPNVLKYTDDEGEMDQLLFSDTAWIVGYWCCNSEGYSITHPWLKGSHKLPYFKGGHANMPGMVWLPVKSEHPLLAQIAVDFELSPAAQLPDIHEWPFGPDEKTAQDFWARQTEGPEGYDYLQYVPDWVNKTFPNGISDLYPTIEEAKKLPILDWGFLGDHVGDLITYWKELTATL